MEMKLELVPVPVTDVDAAITFYRDKLGFSLDHDHAVSDDVRFVQLTPQGSACSIAFGKGITPMKPGSQQALQVVVDDAAATRQALLDNGVEASELDVQPWGTFVYFTDPDGNGWAVQQLPERGAGQTA